MQHLSPHSHLDIFCIYMQITIIPLVSAPALLIVGMKIYTTSYAQSVPLPRGFAFFTIITFSAIILITVVLHIFARVRAFKRDRAEALRFREKDIEWYGSELRKPVASKLNIPSQEPRARPLQAEEAQVPAQIPVQVPAQTYRAAEAGFYRPFGGVMGDDEHARTATPEMGSAGAASQNSELHGFRTGPLRRRWSSFSSLGETSGNARGDGEEGEGREAFRQQGSHPQSVISGFFDIDDQPNTDPLAPASTTFSV